MVHRLNDAGNALDLVDIFEFIYVRKTIILMVTFLMTIAGFLVYQLSEKKWTPMVDVSFSEADIIRAFPAIQTLASVSYKLDKLGNVGNLIKGPALNYRQLFQIMFQRALYDPVSLIEFDKDFVASQFPKLEQDLDGQTSIAIARYLQSRLTMELEHEGEVFSHIYVSFDLNEQGKAKWLLRYVEFVLSRSSDLLKEQIATATEMQLDLLESVIELRKHEYRSEVQSIRSALASAKKIGLEKPVIGTLSQSADQLMSYMLNGELVLQALLDAKSRNDFIDETLWAPLAMVAHLKKIDMSDNGNQPLGALTIREFGLNQSSYGLSFFLGTFAFMGLTLSLICMTFWALLRLPSRHAGSHE